MGFESSRKRVRAPHAERTYDAAPGRVLAVVPVIEEMGVIGRRKVPTGTVRITGRRLERRRLVNEPVVRQEAEVHRVAINRFIESPLRTRREGDTLIIPVMEEVLVVEKRLLLREEVHVRARRRVSREEREVVLRRWDVKVEREPAENHGPETNTRHTRSRRPIRRERGHT